MGHGKSGKAFIADYVFEYRNTRLAVVEELEQEKLTPLLPLKYHDSIADAIADMGKPDEIGAAFTSFQQYLYTQQAA